MSHPPPLAPIGVKLRGSQGGEEREELAADEADKRTRDWEKKVSRKGEKGGAPGILAADLR